jgi:hypothetical protein
MLQSMYSKCTKTVDPHTIITIFLILSLYYMLFLIDVFVFSVLNSHR